MEDRYTKKIGKRHSAHLSLYPQELLQFLAMYGADNHYGQIYMPIKADPYINSCIKRFHPSQQFKTSIHAATPAVGSDFIFSILAELNAECSEWNENKEYMVFADDLICVDIEEFTTAPTPCPPNQASIAPSVPEIGPLTASILASDDKLFFVSHHVPGSAMTECALARVDLQLSGQAHPASLQDGRFLVDFLHLPYFR